MFNSLKGVITYKAHNTVHLDVNGWEWDLYVPASTIDSLGDIGSTAKIYTWLYVRDDQMKMFGFASEEEYLKAWDERKYRWRQYCSNRYGVDPERFETREAYNKAVAAEAAKEHEAKADSVLSDPANTLKYLFCKVSLDYPFKPHLYYFPGKYALSVGDTVVVPYGEDDEEREGVVTAVGECYGFAFPCPVDRVRMVIRLGKKER